MHSAFNFVASFFGEVGDIRGIHYKTTHHAPFALTDSAHSYKRKGCSSIFRAFY